MASSMSAVLKEKACRAMYRSCKGRGRVTLLTPSFSFRALISHSFQSRGSDTTDNSKACQIPAMFFFFQLPELNGITVLRI